jgi:hypothetical protein
MRNEDKNCFGTLQNKWRPIRMSGLLIIRTRQLNKRNLIMTANDGPQI